ncbi:hypothetical protein PENTCL1PPCAC_26926 [Pristionchus entomophagus]|uniref:Nondiscriminating glutamyl-tRNA synthetase EARS2, mitochondrial n=1 Tax=Pristionchus entomophagus TaxID=358040 RepID=A0AAV5UEI7_9BILA|nr:hypothetical protein PENTCL1PPCAC_26926 [Pristionchus entomophagus]
MLLRPRWISSTRVPVRFSQDEVRVRFAPSPTGELHLGGLRTALYNYLFARNHGGKFIVRIEDTDRTRLVEGSADRIRNILSHYGLKSDEDPWQGGSAGPYTQSERLPIYAEHAESLIDSGHAYRCFCSSNRLDLLRKNAAREGAIPLYDRRCRSISTEDARKRAENGEENVIRFIMDHQEVGFEDAVFGSITQRLEESDPVLLKSDGFPTYHLANIVDDKTMRISHVIRGMEWLSSTGKHILMYKAFGWSTPRFVHLPLITRDGKKKLSKRDKDAFVDYYDKEMGVLPQAVINFLVRNGSGVKDFDLSKLYTLQELVELFDVLLIGRRNFQLDADSLSQYGNAAFRSASDRELIDLIRGRVESDLPSTYVNLSDEYLKKVIVFLREKEETFAYLSQLTKGQYTFFFTRPKSAEKILSKFSSEIAVEALDRILESGNWNIDSLKGVAKSLEIAYPKLLSLLRLSLIDGTSGPPITELHNFFGEKECTNRIRQMREHLRI